MSKRKNRTSKLWLFIIVLVLFSLAYLDIMFCYNKTTLILQLVEPADLCTFIFIPTISHIKPKYPNLDKFFYLTTGLVIVQLSKSSFLTWKHCGRGVYEHCRNIKSRFTILKHLVTRNSWKSHGIKTWWGAIRSSFINYIFVRDTQIRK